MSPSYNTDGKITQCPWKAVAKFDALLNSQGVETFCRGTINQSPSPLLMIGLCMSKEEAEVHDLPTIFEGFEIEYEYSGQL